MKIAPSMEEVCPGESGMEINTPYFPPNAQKPKFYQKCETKQRDMEVETLKNLLFLKKSGISVLTLFSKVPFTFPFIGTSILWFAFQQMNLRTT